MKPIKTPRNIVGAMLTIFALLPARGALAQQDIVDPFRQSLRAAAKASKQGSAFQALSIFGATPGVSTAVFNVDHSKPGTDLTLRTLKLPLSHEFDPVIAGIRPYAELTLAYGNARETDDLTLVPPQRTKIDGEFNTYSALSGVGVTIPVIKYVSVRPVLLAGYSRIEGDGNFTGPYDKELKAASSGLIGDMYINTVLLGGALEALAAVPLGEGIQLDADVRYNEFYARNVDASDSVLETSDNFGVFTARTEVGGPTPLTIFGWDTRWIAFAGNTYLPGDIKDALGFDYFFEVGGGFTVIDSNNEDALPGVSFRASLIAGEDVTGWSAGFALEL